MDAEQFLLSKYPGDNPIIIGHIKMAAKQLKFGQTIGIRATPVVSFWMMKDKWKKLGQAWMTIGQDGDAYFDEDKVLQTPKAITLVYFVTNDDLVCQLAYLVESNKLPDVPEVKEYPIVFDDKPNNLQPLDNVRVDPMAEAKAAKISAEAANEIISSMSKIYG